LDQTDEGSAFLPETTPETGDIVLPPRQGFSAFWAGTLQSHLEQCQAQDIYLAGMLAEGCIESHARDAAANGYRPIVIGDAIGATSRDLLEASLQSLVLHTHSLPSTDEVLAECTAS
jgi:nicotinamidase-related amidase